jgi:hypothetical protein
MIECRGLALGVGKGERFARSIEQIELVLEPGDLFFQYTDGLVEATNKEKEQFGEDRLRDVLKRYARTSCTELVDITVESLNDFSRSREQEDDITMVALKVKDPQALTRTARFEMPKTEKKPSEQKPSPPAGFAPPQPTPSPPQGGVGPPGGLPDWMK